jgi:hypothetical protein
MFFLCGAATINFKLSFHAYSFKFILKVGVEESIVNAPLVRLQSKNTNNKQRKK